ncbi:MAG: hypothetical protein PVH41_02045 [Anaerolineae bacterium]|jgi:hypothetical protein
MHEPKPSNEETPRRGFSFDWVLWVKWILACTLGWVIGWAFLPEFAVGALVGAAQWVVVRPLIRRDGWWVPASAAGWAVGRAIVLAVFPPGIEALAEAVIGASLGLAQWLVLRGQVHRAWWWIVLSTLGWTVGLMGTLGSSWAGAVAGATTGVALEFLMRVRRAGSEAG